MDENKIMTLGGKTYRLTFEDNFEGDSLDLTKWSLCPEQRRQDIGGRWADSEVSVHDGNLWLRARTMMFPKTTGFWGAFWMMCGQVGKVDGSAVSGAEIDIIESGECARRGVNHAIHWDGYGEAHKAVSRVIPTVPELYEGWHTYALQWTAEEYVFYIDGKETWRTSEPGICAFPGYLKLTTEFGSWAAPVVPEELPDYCRVSAVKVWTEV